MSPTLFIFDFDDTLFPTERYCAMVGRNKKFNPFNTPAQAAAMANLEEEIISLFKTCLSQGPVFIVSNGSLEWLDGVLARYMVQLSTLIVENSIPVISARDEAGGDPNASRMTTKVKIFEREFLNMFENPAEGRLVSVGDGQPERHAVQELKKKYPEATLLEICFVEQPNMHALLFQIKVTQDIVGDLPKLKAKNGVFVLQPPPGPRIRITPGGYEAIAPAPAEPTLMQRMPWPIRLVFDLVRLPFVVGRWLIRERLSALLFGEENNHLLPH